jgi:DNA-binding NarL/FixJ family response regulator
MTKKDEKAIRILIVDDHAVVRTGLRTMIELRPRLQVVAEAEDAEQAVHLFREHRPDVTLMDLRLPDEDGISATRRIREEFPSARFLVISTLDGDEDIHRALKAGALGYVFKTIPGLQLIEAIFAVAEGQRYVPEDVERRLKERDAFGELTSREYEVLELMVKGLTNREIGDILKVTEFTAKAHVRSLLAKLGAADRTEAATLAVQRGLVHLRH